MTAKSYPVQRHVPVTFNMEVHLPPPPPPPGKFVRAKTICYTYRSLTQAYMRSYKLSRGDRGEVGHGVNWDTLVS